MSITDINPVSALAEMIDDDIYEERVSRKDIEIVLNDISEELWRNKAFICDIRLVLKALKIINFL